jgi:hypothetical protein
VYWKWREVEHGCFTVLCTETGDKKNVGFIQCCLLKLERNERGGYTDLCTETGEK